MASTSGLVIGSEVAKTGWQHWGMLTYYSPLILVNETPTLSRVAMHPAPRDESR